jgi:UDP-N-acetylglucosamine--N-acetylmuramyl-(pentapeptide) pyrophosphoryl-undecaprenol N-acetylglucosamine transferase
MRAHRCIVFTGGGTAGHVFPGVAVIDALEKRWQLRIVWIGSKGGVERRLLENLSLAYLSVPSGKWRRYLSLLNFADLFRVVAGFVRCLLFFFKVRPLLVFSKGGYVSVPPVLAAKLLRIPVFTHESDLSPGLATRINARFSERILTSFDATRSFFPPRLARRVLLTGNPIREFLRRGDPDEGRRLLGCPQGRLILLILGGSQGSSSRLFRGGDAPCTGGRQSGDQPGGGGQSRRARRPACPRCAGSTAKIRQPGRSDRKRHILRQ